MWGIPSPSFTKTMCMYFLCAHRTHISNPVPSLAVLLRFIGPRRKERQLVDLVLRRLA